MCGIAGKVARKAKVSKVMLQRMGDAIAHRGPDDVGYYLSPDQKIGLAHRRLAVIDLSPLGHQPMAYLNRYWIVYNGEIYNFQEKRAALMADGYTFQSKTDTEVIVALYDKYGVECLAHLRGMFAFALYDTVQKTLFCARDRVGKKPFKYYLDDTVFLFGSELKAILTQPEYKKVVDYEALWHYLTLGYTPCPQTGFQGIKKLPPGHYLLFDQASHTITLKKYWQLAYEPKEHRSHKEWEDRIRHTLSESVRLRLISDVPLGALLSGGLDSSAVVAYMSEFSSKPVKTFSIGFTHDRMNELPQAKLVSDYFGTHHTEFVIEPDTIDLLPKLVWHYEEPYADSSALPSYIVSKLTREHVTVALNGDGGDENFGGYDRYVVQKVGLAYDRLRIFNRLVRSGINLIRHRSQLIERTQRFVSTLDMGYERRFVGYTAFFTEAQKQTIATKKFACFGQYSTADLLAPFWHILNAKDKLDQTFGADLQTYLPDDLLTKMDIANMAVSLEGRSPFLDHTLLELTAKIPSALKIRGTTKKYIFKQAMTGILPDAIMRLPKRGFSIPLSDWFRGPLLAYTRDLLLSSTATGRGLFDSKVVESMITDHAAGQGHYAHHLWALVTLEWWFRLYFNSDSVKP